MENGTRMPNNHVLSIHQHDSLASQSLKSRNWNCLKSRRIHERLQLINCMFQAYLSGVTSFTIDESTHFRGVEPKEQISRAQSLSDHALDPHFGHRLHGDMQRRPRHTSSDRLSSRHQLSIDSHFKSAPTVQLKPVGSLGQPDRGIVPAYLN